MLKMTRQVGTGRMWWAHYRNASSTPLLIVIIGKTTLARVLANGSDSRLVELSATSSGTAEVRAAFEEAKNALKLTGK